MNEKEVINACIVEVLKDIKNYIHCYVILSEYEEDKLIGFINNKIKEHGGEA